MPFFFRGWRPVPGAETAGFAEAPATGSGGVIDILLLLALPFRRRPRKLPFDSFDLPPILPLGSLAVTPLRPVDVGDGWILCEDDRDGT